MEPALARRGLLLGALALPGSAFAGAWVPQPGHGYAEVQQVVFPGVTRAFGDLEFLGQLGTHLYGEVGLFGGRLALVARGTPFQYTTVPGQDRSRGGVGDTALGLRLGLDRGPSPIALEAHVVLPTGLGDGLLPTGFGAWGAAGGLYVGDDFRGPWWGQAGLLGEWHQGYGAAARLEVAGGYVIGLRWQVDGTVILRVALGPPADLEQRVMYRSDERWGTLNLRARYMFTDGYHVFGGLDLGLLSVNAPGGVPVTLGVSADW